jgi:3-oxoacyl-[acyl-carrier protein] reductase
VNVAEPAPVEAGVKAVLERWGKVDVLVNNAGILRDAQLVKWKDGAVAATLSDDAWDAVIGVNLKGVFHCTRAVVPHMIKAGRRRDPERLVRGRASTATSGRPTTSRARPAWSA